MKWKIGKEAAEGETRVVRKFLFLPKYISREWRWFEMATIKQVRIKVTPLNPSTAGGCYSPGDKVLAWCDIEWIDTKPVLTEGNMRGCMKKAPSGKRPVGPPPPARD